MTRVREEIVILQQMEGGRFYWEVKVRGHSSKREAEVDLKDIGAQGETYQIARFIGPSVRVEVETVKRARIVPAAQEVSNEETGALEEKDKD